MPAPNAITRYRKHPRFIVHEDEPFNGGTPTDLLRQEFVTPLNQFYVRAHSPVPSIDAATYRLTINGMVHQPLSLSLDDLKREFPRQTVMATLQCAGNRRAELHQVEPIPDNAVIWNTEAISNAEWRGVALSEVLRRAGITPDAAHVAFTSLDHCEKEGEIFGYGGSIPVEKALSAGVLLAYEMNGEALLPVHGFPLRVIVPGYVAARSVKWVGTITAQSDISDNFYQQRDYKLFPRHINPDNVNWTQGEMLEVMQTDAVICTPEEGAALAAGSIIVQGYAIARDHAEITGVELSIDGGTTWIPAALTGEARLWTWRFWEAALELSAGEYELCVRTHDTQGTIQPQHPAEVWNFRGYMNNSIHRVHITVQ